MPAVDGSETLALPPARVWELLNDPETLGAAIPGCHGLERDGDEEHRYLTSIAVAIGAVKGVYDGTVTYADIDEPERCTIKVAGRGEKGTIDGQGAIELRPADGGTEVVYRGEFKLTGPVAGIGQRLAPGVSRKMIVETLHNLERSGAPAAGQEVPQDGGEAAAAPTTGEPAPGSVPPARAAPPREVEAFDPVPPWVKAGGLIAIGMVVGFLIGRLV